MILKIRNSRFSKAVSLLMALIFILTLNPTGSFALTGGPAQPEFNSFTPIGTSDMVDLASGDFSYNIPLMDVGGFPINLAYNSGVTMDQEASWVGLGWDLSIGQINRQMRGLPDDFDGDEVLYENNVKDNVTVGGTFQFSPEVLGIEFLSGGKGDKDTSKVQITIGLSAQYNTYNGFGLSPSAGVSFDLARMGSVGLNATSTPDGLVLTPSLSLNPRIVNGKKRDGTLGVSFGTSFNSRQGLTSVNMSTSNRPSTGLNKIYNKRMTIAGSSKSFVPNTYTPDIQANMVTQSSTFNTAFGTEFFGGEGEGEISAFTSTQSLVLKEEYKKSFGYEHTHKAPKEAVLDFNREKDGVFTENSTNLPLTNYTYDLYSVQGQGVGGMFQPYRSQVGYVFDNSTYNASSDISGGVEIGVGSAAHTGGDVETVYSSTRAGIWEDDNDAISSFDDDPSLENLDYEEVYFKNVGDLSADQDMGMYSSTNLGAYNPIQFSLSGGAYARTLNNNYMLKGGTTPGSTINPEAIKRDQRVRRNQTILKVSVAEADSITSFIKPVGTYVKPHHTAGFVITRNDGARYNYGKVLYNTKKRETTFAVGSGIGGSSVPGAVGDISSGLVTYLPGLDNSLGNVRGDHYFNRIHTPAYGHTFLLTSLVSTDYSDTDGELGPSEGDLGSYTKFQYRDMGLYKWRVPFEAAQANFNEGLKTDPTDDKASYVYGEKETSYIQKIETKTHLALFYISPRKDGYGVSGEDGGIGVGSIMYQLDSVALYSRGEFYADGITTAEGDYGNIVFTSSAVPTPIKTVHFVYDYELCVGVPNNIDNYEGLTLLPESERTAGKLTLKKVYFTYRNSNMGQYAAYDFTYNDIDHNGEISEDEENKRNPSYNLKGYDIWGCYKENAASAGSGAIDPLSAPEFNYVEQKTNEERALADQNAAAWSITDISLPSGGKIQIDYEADDYQYVQDKKAMRMFKLAGAGDDPNPASSTFDFNPTPATALENQTNGEALLYKGGNDALYLYFELDEEDQIPDLSTEEFRKKYVNDIYNSQDRLLQFRMLLNMTHKGGKNSGSWQDEPFDYVSGYAELDNIDQCNSYMVGGVRYGSIKMRPVKMEGGFVGSGLAYVNPISKAGWHFGRKYLSKFIYGGGDIDGDGADVEEILGKIKSRMGDLLETFAGPNARLHEEEVARRFVPEKSWIRLCEPTTHKKGGGSRVKQIAMTDEWAAMNGISEPTTAEDRLYNQKYGQQYTYTLKDGGSSGVATYEPVGSKENPLVQPDFVNVNRLLAPDEENYMEKPFGESFFPNPQVTYSRVSVKNLEREDDLLGKSVIKHATGHVVTEFYTSKDYPVITDQTELEPLEDSNPLLMSLLQVNIVKHLTVSQGYLIHLNDMNGKMKSQRVYAEGQTEAISGVDYLYDHHTSPNPEDWLEEEENMNLVLDNKGRLKNLVPTIDPNGQVSLKDIGVEYNIVNDFREMRSLSTTIGMDINAAFYTIGPIPVAIPVPIPKYARHADQLRIATTTKIINSYGILRATVAYDAGAVVSTRNLAWDSETGEVLVTETVNEFDDKYYSMNYPAHWYYKGMGQAAFNSGLSTPIVPGVGAGNYKTVEVAPAETYFHLGDEVLIRDETGLRLGWIDELTGTEFSLIDVNGNDLTLTGAISMRVIRSGRRNIQSTSMGSLVMMENPVGIISGGVANNIFDTEDWSEFKIVNTGAVEFRDDWALQCECAIDNVNEIYNPYRFNTLGIWRAYKSHLYLTGRHQDATASPRMDGFYNSYASFYEYNDGWQIAPDAYSKWTFTSEVTQYSPYGFELENADALARYSAAQYGYNFSFPLAVAANSKYAEMGFDGFEDYNFDGCPDNEHFGFRGNLTPDDFEPEDGVGLTKAKSHTGRYSLRIPAGQNVENTYRIDCDED